MIFCHFNKPKTAPIAKTPIIMFLGVNTLLVEVFVFSLVVDGLFATPPPIPVLPALPVIMIISVGILLVTFLVKRIFTIVPILTEKPLSVFDCTKGAVSSFDLSTTAVTSNSPNFAWRMPLSNWFCFASGKETPKPVIFALLNVEPLGMIISLYCAIKNNFKISCKYTKLFYDMQLFSYFRAVGFVFKNFLHRSLLNAIHPIVHNMRIGASVIN